jgi:hypothetical protein
MPDIAMCRGIDCPFKDKCYRHTAKPDKYQSYFANPPIKDGRCDYYWGENAEYVWSNVSQKEQE